MNLEPLNEILNADPEKPIEKGPNPYSCKKEFTLEEVNLDLDRKIRKCEDYMNSYRAFSNEFFIKDEQLEEASFNLLHDVQAMIKELEDYKTKINKESSQ